MGGTGVALGVGVDGVGGAGVIRGVGAGTVGVAIGVGAGDAGVIGVGFPQTPSISVSMKESVKPAKSPSG